MADIGSINSRGPTQAVPDTIAQNTSINRTTGEPLTDPHAAADAAVGPRGPLGQPTGLPVPSAPGERGLLTDVLAGLDPSQMIAAEQMRTRAGASAVDTLLGLNARPTTIGAFAAPPLSSKIFQQMSPAMRRAAMWSLVMKQRGQLQRLVSRLQAEYEREAYYRNPDEDESPSDQDRQPRIPINPSALMDLNSVAQMLNTIERLLILQDYALSRIGTFAKG